MNKLGKHAKRQRTVSNAMQSEKLEHRTSNNRGTAHQHNPTRRGGGSTTREDKKKPWRKRPLTDISSDPAELCALPQMISLTAQGIAEAAKGSQNQCTEELQREMRSLAFKKMWWKLDKLMMMMMIPAIVTYISWPL